MQTNLITQGRRTSSLPLLTRQNKGEDEYKQVRVAIVDSIAMPEIVPPSLAEHRPGLDRPLLEHAGDARRRHVQPAGAQVGREGRARPAARRWPRRPRSPFTPTKPAAPKAAPIPMHRSAPGSASRKASRSKTTSPKWSAKTPTPPPRSSNPGSAKRANYRSDRFAGSSLLARRPI